MISILAVNRNCLEWMQLLVKSVKKFTLVPYEIIILDNNSEDGSYEWLKEENGVRPVPLPNNIGHGMGLDALVRQACHRFCLVLDIDAHLQHREWGYDLLDLYMAHPKRRLIAAKGGEKKPVHPCFMFFEREFFIKHNLKFIPTKEYDVGRKLYSDVLELGYEVFRVPVGYESQGKKFYDGAYGDEYYINGKPMVYHNWYSSRMYKKEQVDGYTKEEFTKRKQIVFDQALVRDILDYKD